MMDFATFETLLQNGGHLAEIVIAFMFVRLDRRIVSIEKDIRHIERDVEKVEKDLKKHEHDELTAHWRRGEA